MERRAKSSCAVILTAIPAEYQAVRSHLSNLAEEVYKGSVYERGLFAAKGGIWEIGIVQSGSGNAITAAEVERAITYFQPHVLFFVGVAGGLKDVRLGDVVVATKVYDYESGKAGTSFQTRPEVGRSTYAMEQRARAEARKQDWLLQIQGTQLVQIPAIHIGPIAAGEKVVASTKSAIIRFLQVHYGDTLAVEMEGYGFLRAAHANHPVEALVIRGISDLINDKSEADAANYQDVAARHASAFAFAILTRFCVAKQPSSQSRENLRQEIAPASTIQRRTDNSITVQNVGVMQAPVQGGSHNIMHNTFIAPKEGIAEGLSYLTRGQTSLSHRDYTIAKQYLVKALRFLHENQVPEKHAQARYLLTLTYLRGERPFGVTLGLWESIEELLQEAIRLNPCFSYTYTFALFKRDFASNGLKKSQLLQEAQQLLQKAANTPHTAVDEENIHLLWLCQPLLIQEENT